MAYNTNNIHSKFILNLNGFKQHFIEWEGHDPPLILIHPKRSNVYHWIHFIECLNISNRLIALDLRGHGLSEYTKNGYSVPNLGKDILSFMKQMKIYEAIFVGCATGGNLCIWLASKYREKVKAIGVLDPGLSIPKQIADEVLRQTFEEHNFPSFEIAKKFMHFQDLWSEEVKEYYAKKSFKKREDGRWEWRYAPQAARNIANSLNKDSVWDLSKKVFCPTLILRGIHSPVFTEEHMEKLSLNISQARVVNLENASHTPAQENPLGLALEIERLINKV